MSGGVQLPSGGGTGVGLEATKEPLPGQDANITRNDARGEGFEVVTERL